MTSISRTELALLYGIDRKTLDRWLKHVHIILPPRQRICWKDQQTIFSIFGDPEAYKRKKDIDEEKKKYKKM